MGGLVNKILVVVIVSVAPLYGLQWLFEEAAIWKAAHITWALWCGWVFAPWLDKHWSGK